VTIGLRPVLVSLLSAATWFAAGAGPSRACASAGIEGLHFVVGNWLVRDSVGGITGTYTARNVSAGCAMIEQWRGVNGRGEGMGVIEYQPVDGRWKRTFTHYDGHVLVLEGKLAGATLLLQGNDYQLGQARANRIIWRARSDGMFAVRWEQALPGTDSWQVRFDGLFQRIAE
jgi:hypothetical protein